MSLAAIITKRESLLTFIGVLRKRFAVSGAGTEHIRGRLPKDVVRMLSDGGFFRKTDPPFNTHAHTEC